MVCEDEIFKSVISFPLMSYNIKRNGSSSVDSMLRLSTTGFGYNDIPVFSKSVNSKAFTIKISVT